LHSIALTECCHKKLYISLIGTKEKTTKTPKCIFPVASGLVPSKLIEGQSKPVTNPETKSKNLGILRLGLNINFNPHLLNTI